MDFETSGLKIVHSNDEAMLYDMGDAVGCIRFFSKANSFSPLVRRFFIEVLDNDAYGFDGIVIGNEGKNFSVGANLNTMKEEIENKDFGKPGEVRTFQKTMQKISNYHKPFVAAPFRNVLGGGLELCLSCHARVSLQKVYMGLVEIGIGLIPGGGGTKHCALIAGKAPKERRDLVLIESFEKLALKKVSKNANEAKNLSYLKDDDVIIENRENLLSAAKEKCFELIANFKQKKGEDVVMLGGRADYLKLLKHADRLKEQGVLSPYDVEIAKRIAHVLAGSTVEDNVRLSETDLLIIENNCFCDLKQQKGTYDRIKYFLETGEMLRN